MYTSVQLTRDGAPSEENSSDEYIELSRGDELWFTSDVIRDLEVQGNLFEALPEVADTQELAVSSTRYYEPFFYFWSLLVPVQVHYEGSLVGTEEGTTYTLSLLREDAKDEPESNDSFSRSSDPIRIEWPQVDDDAIVQVAADVSCPNGEFDSYAASQIADQGHLELAAGELGAMEVSGTCSTTLTVAKFELGELDTGFVHGVISGHQDNRLTSAVQGRLLRVLTSFIFACASTRCRSAISAGFTKW